MLSEIKAKEMFNDYLDNVYGIVKVLDYEYLTSDILKEVDPIAYDEEFSNWVDSEQLEVEGF